jgi:hypothetical protein
MFNFWKMKNKIIIEVFLIFILLVLAGSSCKKLDTKVYDRINYLGKTREQIDAAVAAVYAGLRDYAPGFPSPFVLNEGSSDEVIVPVRGGDWYDNGTWERMWKHTWGPELFFMDEGWRFIYGGIARVNSTLDIVNSAKTKPADYDYIIASLKTIRAFYYYLALDWFGNVPISEPGVTQLSKLSYKKRDEVFVYVEKELKDNLPALTEDVNQNTYGMATKWFAHSLLAKLYLNAQVYTGKPRWADCIAACNAVLNSNKYILEPDFFTNFKIANEISRENIFVIPFDNNNNLNFFWLQISTLHYESGATFGLPGGGANGFSTPAGIYNLFDASDIRRKMFLVGQQYEGQTQYVYEVRDSQYLQYDHAVNLPLSFDPDIKTFSSTDPAFRMAGVRCAKWEFNKDNSLMSNDFAVYRLADIILMKAEAQFRNGDINNALATINQKYPAVSIRSRTGLPDFTLTDMTLDNLLAERGRELSWEGFRRNDLIRFGHFLDARVPEKNVSGSFRLLYPIPKSQIDKNPYLVQNPGY